MTNREKIEFLYKEDGMRNDVFLKELLHNDFILDWDSSHGNVNMNKEDIVSLAKELKLNYVDSFMEISHLIEDNNQIVVKYNHKVTTIENPNEFVLIAKVVAIWEFEEYKIKKGYQISKPN
jgi:hypothetical protein